MNRETALMHLIMVALSEAGCIVWRNNTGQAWHGAVIHRAGKQVTLSDSRMQPYGLCVGSSDLIGITADGRFLAVEVKTSTGRATAEQRKFIDAVRLKGGIAGIARSVDEAIALLRG